MCSTLPGIEPRTKWRQEEWHGFSNLKPGSKEWFMPALREAYPHLMPRYEKYYRGAYAPKEYTQQVLAKVSELRERYGFSERAHAPTPQREHLGQLQMAL